MSMEREGELRIGHVALFLQILCYLTLVMGNQENTIPHCHIIYVDQEVLAGEEGRPWYTYYPHLNMDTTQNKAYKAGIFVSVFLDEALFPKHDTCLLDIHQLLPSAEKYSDGLIDLIFFAIGSIKRIVFLPVGEPDLRYRFPAVGMTYLKSLQNVDYYNFHEWIEFFQPIGLTLYFDPNNYGPMGKDLYQTYRSQINTTDSMIIRETAAKWWNGSVGDVECLLKPQTRGNAFIFPLTCNASNEYIALNVSKLQVFEIGPNSLQRFLQVTHISWPNLSTLGIAESILSSWDDLQKTIKVIPSLHELSIMNSTIPGEIPSFQRSDIEMITVKYMDFRSIGVRNIPRNCELFRCEYCNLSVIAPDAFIYASKLFTLKLGHNKITNLNFINSETCPSLWFLDLSSNEIEELGPEKKWPRSLVYLLLNYNRISKIRTENFKNLKRLRYLGLKNNKIKVVDKFDAQYLSNLDKLDLSFNRLQKINLSSFFESTIQSLTLNLSHNELHRMNFDSQDLSYVSSLIKSSVIDASYNGLVKIPGDLLTLSMSNHVDLSYNNITFQSWMDILEKQWLYKLKLGNLIGSPKISVDLKGNQIRNLQYNFTVIQYTRLYDLLSDLTWDLTDNHIECDCHASKIFDLMFLILRKTSWQESFVSWVCHKPYAHSGSPLLILVPTDFMCDVTEDISCPVNCSCSRMSANELLYVNCSSRDLDQSPSIIPMLTHTLDLSNNAIESFNFRQLFERPTLKRISLAKNRLVELEGQSSGHAKLKLERLHLDYNALQTLPRFLSNARIEKWYIGNNPFACDCNNKWFHQWLRDNVDKVKDIDDVICATGKPQGRQIRLITVDDMVCLMSRSTKIFIVVGTVSVSMLFIILMLYCFRGEIKLFLFTRFNWHPFDRREEDDVKDKLYDVFISYSGRDDAWVEHEFIHKIETLERPYRLCLGVRDFLPTVSVSENVCNGIKYSRRMIMLLTRNFLHSEWCTLEFKTAHQRVLKERSNFLIIILADNINMKDLDEDLKLYLRTNTYIELKSKWFWQRLAYALPEVPLALLRGHDMPPGGFAPLFPNRFSLAAVARQMPRNNDEREEEEEEDIALV